MCNSNLRLAGVRALLGIAVLLLAWSAGAQGNSPGAPPNGPEQQSAHPITTMFPHPDTAPWFVAAQINVISQGHPPFHAAYSGALSLNPHSEWRTSEVLTLYMGLQLKSRTEILLDFESAGGRGISDALGLAGFTNLDVVRNPELGRTPYLARAMFHYVLPLSGDTIEAERGPFSLFTRLPARRLELRAGKFSMADSFDMNAVGSDSHLQFMNWTVDNNGAYDYAADTRGYTSAVMLDYEDRSWGVRFAESLMPKVANGSHLQWDLRRAHAENVELDLSPRLLPDRLSAVRLLAFVNHANMGEYDQAIANFLEHRTAIPEVSAHPPHVAVKYGFGLNLEQAVSANARVFARWGWNEGQHESYAYTEVDQTWEFGADYRGALWRRNLDRVGAAFVSNGIARPHQQYLALGGHGFLLGDGALDYGRETIEEAYYTVHLWRGLYTGFDLQHINNPGYNRARGPVLVPAIRIHLEL